VHLTPAHYAFLIFWERLLGDDPLDYRLFSVFVFLITLPFLFLLMRELFASDLAGWIAVSLYAVSPFIHIYAQEARYYILWSFIFILSSWLFLKTTNNTHWKWGVVYAVSLLIALYISVISALFILGHLIYVLLYKRNAFNQYALYWVIVLLLYAPWIYSMYLHREQIVQSLSWHIVDISDFGITPLLMGLLFGFKRSLMYLFDLNLYSTLAGGISSPELGIMLLTDFLMIGFVIYIVIFLFRNTPYQKSLFLYVLVGPMILFFFILDIYRNSFTCWFWRYQIIIMAGIIIMVSSMFYYKIKDKKLLFSALHMLIIVLGLLSILSHSDDRCCLKRDDCASNISDAQLFSGSGKTLLITDFNRYSAGFLVMLNECNSNDIDILFINRDCDIKTKIADKNYPNIFVTHVSDSLLDDIKDQFEEGLIPLKDTIPMFASQVWRVN